MTSTMTIATPDANEDLLFARIRLTDGTYTHITKVNKRGYSVDAEGVKQIPTRMLVRRSRYLLQLDEAPAKGKFVVVNGMCHIFTAKELKAMEQDDDAVIDFSRTVGDLDKIKRIMPKEPETEQPLDASTPNVDVETKHVMTAPVRRLLDEGALTLNVPQVKAICQVLGVSYDHLDADQRRKLKHLSLFTADLVSELSETVKKSKTKKGGTKAINTDGPQYLNVKSMNMIMQDVKFRPVNINKKAYIKAKEAAGKMLVNRLGLAEAEIRTGLLLQVQVSKTKTAVCAYLCTDSLAINLVDIKNSTIHSLPIYRKTQRTPSVESLSLANDALLDEEVKNA